MINSTTLTDITTDYMNECHQKHIKPTYKGLAQRLDITGHTIGNIIRGTYNGKPYGDKPGHKRCIDNKDFEKIREVYEAYSKKYEVSKVTPKRYEIDTKKR